MLDFGFYNMDCMEGMKQFPDKYFDLAVVDPPYGNGLGDGGGSRGWFDKFRPENIGGGENWNRFGGRFDRYKDPKGGHGKQAYHLGTPKRTESTELVEHGRRSSKKNHCVGRCPETGIF